MREWQCRGKSRSCDICYSEKKKKHAVQEDIWIPGASQPGEQQHVEAVVSTVYVLKQIKDVIEFRETWLRQNNLPMDYEMRDKIEIPDFLKWAKGQYHSEDYQSREQNGAQATSHTGRGHSSRVTQQSGATQWRNRVAQQSDDRLKTMLSPSLKV